MTGGNVLLAADSSSLRPRAERVPIGAGFAEVEAPELGAAELAAAFEAFSSAAKSLERSYFSLGQEVCRLRKELDQERDLRRRREALAEISAVLAHEIRNPLASMDLFAGLLAGSALDEEKSQWVEQIRSALRILSATVNNVLEFHRQRPLELAEIELNAVLQSVEMLLAPVAQQAKMKWIRELSSEPLWIRADRQRLEQVFLNLAMNAFRFALQGGVLRVRTERDTEVAVISFADEGPGISRLLFQTIFESRVATCPGGSGLGLPISRHIIQQHGGTIVVTSHPGQGACFRITLPLGNTRGVKP